MTQSKATMPRGAAHWQYMDTRTIHCVSRAGVLAIPSQKRKELVVPLMAVLLEAEVAAVAVAAEGVGAEQSWTTSRSYVQCWGSNQRPNYRRQQKHIQKNIYLFIVSLQSLQIPSSQLICIAFL
ncbi:hypothetical protein PGT21_027623 [Puccinia graminis f. sp. tritici]|uniref:Uncharacterized protein n=1 Tax=Puccinia graminis f. sp. tritici TaxID=56615 RepID=A0A5B0MFX4_PUCGR|nr:hypothetical protein PGT21_027623 [Puccinia graminis f. sp. tritici]